MCTFATEIDNMTQSEKLGHSPVGKLLLKQAIPTFMGILVMSIL